MQVKGYIDHADFFQRITPAIEQLDLNIKTIMTDAAAQAEVVSELTAILQRAPHLEQIKSDTKALITQADEAFLKVLSAK